MSTEHDSRTLSAIKPLREAGFAPQWLHPRQKRPIGDGWQDVPVASLDELLRSHRPGNNLGVRLGEPSLTPSGYLHAIDVDIRLPDLAEEAWAKLRALLGDVIDTLPRVVSGSGGESRHLYFVSERPFFGKKLAVSEGKHRRLDPTKGREVWSYDWEIELFGTGKQVAMPPSIHPDTGLAYTWERPFLFELLDVGVGPEIPAAAIEALGAAEAETYAFESREPLTFDPGQMERDLESLPVSRIDDYHDWITLGQALHHQFGGSDRGYEIWVEQSKRSTKFDGKNLLRRWRGFGRNRRQPVTMATIRAWAADARAAAFSADAFDDLADDEPAPAATETATPDVDWMTLLQYAEDGSGIKATLHNLELIVRHDPRLIGLPQLNLLTQDTVQRSMPGAKAKRLRARKEVRQLRGPIWQISNTIDGELWSESRDYAIRSILEAPKSQGGYGIKITDRDLRAAIDMAAQENAFHPIREYLTRVTWDQVPRVESLWIDYVKAPDDAYHRAVARLMMVAGVTRIFEPGHKFDFATILEGIQGKRKSTLIGVLGRRWFGELDGDFHDSKQMIELMQGKWILEIPELTGFGRSDVRAIKAFISRQNDRARLAYARRAGEYPRQCVFIGSTNDREYLKDDTGGRRFWPVQCRLQPDEEIDTDRLARNVDQLWAEAVAIYREMRQAQPHGVLPLYLTGVEARLTALQLQESRRQESAEDVLAGQIGEWLERPINNGGFDDDPTEPTYRNETCTAQIWVECLGKDLANFKGPEQGLVSRALRNVPDWAPDNAGTQHRFEVYGKQRVFYRGGEAGRRARLGL